MEIFRTPVIHSHSIGSQYNTCTRNYNEKCHLHHSIVATHHENSKPIKSCLTSFKCLEYHFLNTCWSKSLSWLSFWTFWDWRDAFRHLFCAQIKMWAVWECLFTFWSVSFLYQWAFISFLYLHLLLAVICCLLRLIN